MKVLCIKQPFVELILQGRKIIELRTWNTKFRGLFLIHASKVPDKKAMERFNFEALPVGKILGRAKLVCVKEYKDKEEFDRDNQFHLATEWHKGYGFVLENVKRINPVNCKGKLGFWNIAI